jgi:adenylate cyclase
MTDGLRERADMQKFVSQSTVEMIQRGPSTPETRAGSRQVITLLFSDIRGFTAFAERRPPEEAVAALNRYLTLQAELVQRFHGDVDKFMGDAVFAHFTGEDKALDAIRCAVEMHKAVRRRRSQTRRCRRWRSASASSPASDRGQRRWRDRLDYTAVGAPVNLAAARAAAEPNETLLNAHDLRGRARPGGAEAPPIAVKGLRIPWRPTACARGGAGSPVRGSRASAGGEASAGETEGEERGEFDGVVARPCRRRAHPGASSRFVRPPPR